jgi:hypothetical protein
VVSPRAGGVVLIPFPFSDLSGSKLRPALVLADVSAGDWVLCQITIDLLPSLKRRGFLPHQKCFGGFLLPTSSLVR